MMKYILVLALALLPLASANLQIQEVLYDPITSETGGEAVQLYNPTDQLIDLTGYIIKTQSSEQDAILPNSILGPNQYYLITDLGWEERKDNPDWPAADHEEPITMTNTNGGVALKNGNQTLDIVCWGDTEFCDTPVARTQPGHSLLRVNNTFIDSVPQWKTSSSNSIQLLVPVTNNPPTIHEATILIDDNLDTEIIEILPAPGKPKIIPLQVNSTATEVKVILNNIEHNLTKQDNLFQGNVSLNHYDLPQTYTIEVIATRDNDQATANLTFDYLPLLALNIDTSNLNFNESMTVLGDQLQETTDKPTITNIGNTEINLGIYGTDLTSNENRIDSNNVKYTFDNDFESNLAGTLSKELEIKNIDLTLNQSQEFSLRVTIPQDTPLGDYIGSLSIVGVAK